MRVHYIPEAVAELHEIVRYYEEKQLGLGEYFIEKLDLSITACTRNPELGRQIDNQIRSLVMQKFPYTIFYRLRQNEITILAIAHQKRLPGYWRNRKA